MASAGIGHGISRGLRNMLGLMASKIGMYWQPGHRHVVLVAKVKAEHRTSTGATRTMAPVTHLSSRALLRATDRAGPVALSTAHNRQIAANAGLARDPDAHEERWPPRQARGRRVPPLLKGQPARVYPVAGSELTLYMSNSNAVAHHKLQTKSLTWPGPGRLDGVRGKERTRGPSDPSSRAGILNTEY